jgi:ADP-ribose pyrophosphatase
VVVLVTHTAVGSNPHGRTGITGRGLLGRFGPNHAADPVVTRWQRNVAGDINKDADNRFAAAWGFGVLCLFHSIKSYLFIFSLARPVLEFVAIKRLDTGEWAIPGGMVEAGDSVSATLRKEFGEEVCKQTNKR